MELHTSENLKAQDGDGDNFHYALNDGERYKLTSGEKKWLLDFVRGRYSVADHIMENIDETDAGELIYTVNTIDLGKAIADDGTFPKAVMLSDDTALQAIIFHSSAEAD